MDFKVFLAVILKMVAYEYPNIEDGSARNAKYLNGAREMAEHYLEVGREGKIVSPDIDPILLATIGYEESRHRPDSPDGDCFFNGMSKEKKCNAFGPMQLNKGIPWVLNRINEDFWEGVTLESLRDPGQNVQAAYDVLHYWKTSCSSDTANFMGSYMSGKCLKDSISPGKKRCMIAKTLDIAMGHQDTIKCPATNFDKRTNGLLKWISKK